MLDQASGHLKTIVADLLRSAKGLGVSAAEASVAQSSGLSASVRCGEIDTIEFNQDKRLSITVYRDHQKGSASTTDLSPAAVLNCLESACSIASHIEADPFNGLVEAADLAKKVVDCDLYHPHEVSVEAAVAQSKIAEDCARAFDSRIVNSEGATFSSRTAYHVYGNSHGFLEGYASTHYSLSSVVLAKSGDSLEQDYDFSVARAIEDLAPPQYVGEQSAVRALSRLHARKIKTQEAPVIFSAQVAASLIGHFVGAISGSSLYRKTSFLLDQLNQAVFPNFLSIQLLPYLKKGLGSAPFDSEGAAPKERYLIEDGVLKGYLLGSYSARKLGFKTTGNCGGIQSLLVSSKKPAYDQKALLKEMGRGLLVTELMGHGVNAITGDYSRGAFGFWVEGGEIQYPVHEITIAGNLKEMYAALVAVGSDVDQRSAILSGSIWCDRMTIAGE
jgi:PmbA protein